MRRWREQPLGDFTRTGDKGKPRFTLRKVCMVYILNCVAYDAIADVFLLILKHGAHSVMIRDAFEKLYANNSTVKEL